MGKRPKSEKELEREEKERLQKKKRKSKADLLKESQEAESAAAEEARKRAEKEQQNMDDAILGSHVVVKDGAAGEGFASKDALTVLKKDGDNVLVLTAAQILEWYSMSELEPAPASASQKAAKAAETVAALAAQKQSAVGARGVESPEKRKPLNKSFLITRFTNDKIEQLKGESGQSATALKISPNVGSLPHDYLEQVCEVLEGNSSIDSFDLDNCGIGDEGCAVIKRLLMSSKSLVSISLQFCNISDKGLQQLLQAFLEGGPSVSSLLLNQNAISDVSAEQLQEVQRKYPTLLLGLKGNSKLKPGSLNSIQQWHVHNPLALHRAAVLHRQQYLSLHESAVDGLDRAKEENGMKAEEMPDGDEMVEDVKEETKPRDVAV